MRFNAFSILNGNGDGTLNAPKTQTVAPFYGFTSGDFNGDEVTDLALLLAPAANSVLTSVQILLGSNSESFSQGAALPVDAAPLGGLPAPMTAIALTNDGNLDLVLYANVMNVFHGDGKGGFTPTGTYAVSAQANGAPSGTGYLFADVNGDGNQDLIVPSTAPGVFIFLGNGGSTFQAPPGTPVSGPVADVNNDGLADMVFLPAQGGNYFGTALGRGDGSFAILNQTTPVPAAPTGYVLITGDFNGDGKTDVIAMQPGSAGPNALTCVTPDAKLLSFLGNGAGGFQAEGTGFALGVSGASSAVTGDFNSDGNLDIIVYYGCEGSGLLLVPGHGDGTFGTPINLNSQNASSAPIVGDLDNDGKLDLITGSVVLLGNGDGTFKQIPLTIPAGSGVIALADLNGDGILDAVSGRGSGPSTGSTIYAGNGDGTFQGTPFFTVPLAPYQYQYSIAAGDVSGDGDPDLLVGESGINGPILAVLLGDGHGNFTADTNSYSIAINTNPASTLPTRLNNQAPALPKDNKLDVLVALPQQSGGAYLVSLLNQNNPAPASPAPLTSTTGLQASLATAAPARRNRANSLCFRN